MIVCCGLQPIPAEKHYGAAVALYTKAIELDSQNAVYYANRSFAHIKLEEYGSAVADASKAIEVDSSYPKVRKDAELHCICQRPLRWSPA